MGGENGPSSFMVASFDLVNSSHCDIEDTSPTITTWSELIPNKASNWNFIFPNVTTDNVHAIVIPLFDGVSISWDGKLLRHASTRVSSGHDNVTSGNAHTS